MLSREAFKDFEQAVGKGNVSDDASTCMSYAWNAGLGGIPKPNRLSAVPPIAVVLPGSTEEVQAVVKTCLRHGIKFKPHSTGYGSFATVAAPNAISVDLRRMDRILEIDRRNQMAVIEPYVTAGQLQAEAMKQALNCHIVGAGLTHSPFASATACIGVGITGTTTSNNARNLLGLEWVDPQGEIVRIGTPGADCGWFSDEGPGPGFRGMIRGVVGTMGGLGIFTRIGYKLYPWPGPKTLVRTGKHPQIGIQIPEHFRLYHLAWDNWADVTKATYDINRSAVAYVLVRISPNGYNVQLAATNNDFYKIATAHDTPDIFADSDACRHTWTLLTAASSEAEALYKERVVQAILARTNGRTVQLTPQHEELVAHNLVSSIFIPRVLRPSSAMATTFGALESFARLPELMKAGEAMLGEDIRPGGHLMQGSSEEFWVWPNERRHMWGENAFSYDVNSPDSRGAVLRVVLDQANLIETRGDLGFDIFGAIGPLADFFSPAANGAAKWMRRIKHRFDKDSVNDAQFYIAAEPPRITKYWPVLRRVLFARPFRPIFRRLMKYFAVVGLQLVFGKPQAKSQRDGR